MRCDIGRAAYNIHTCIVQLVQSISNIFDETRKWIRYYSTPSIWLLIPILTDVLTSYNTPPPPPHYSPPTSIILDISTFGSWHNIVPSSLLKENVHLWKWNENQFWIMRKKIDMTRKIHCISTYLVDYLKLQDLFEPSLVGNHLCPCSKFKNILLILLKNSCCRENR